MLTLIKMIKMKKVLAEKIEFDINTATPKETYKLGIKMANYTEYEYIDGTMHFYNYEYDNLLTFEDIDKFHKEIGEDFFDQFNLNGNILECFKGFLLAKFPKKCKEILEVKDGVEFDEIEGFEYNSKHNVYKYFVEFCNLTVYTKNRVQAFIYEFCK